MKFFSGRQLHLPVERVTGFDDLDCREQGGGFIHRPHDGVEFPDTGDIHILAGCIGPELVFHGGEKGKAGADDDVGGVQLSGVAQHGVADIGLETAEGRQPHHSQDDAQEKHRGLLAVLAQFAQNQPGQHRQAPNWPSAVSAVRPPAETGCRPAGRWPGCELP